MMRVESLVMQPNGYFHATDFAGSSSGRDASADGRLSVQPHTSFPVGSVSGHDLWLHAEPLADESLPLTLPAEAVAWKEPCGCMMRLEVDL